MSTDLFIFIAHDNNFCLDFLLRWKIYDIDEFSKTYIVFQAQVQTFYFFSSRVDSDDWTLRPVVIGTPFTPSDTPRSVVLDPALAASDALRPVVISLALAASHALCPVLIGPALAASDALFPVVIGPAFAASDTLRL